MAVLDVICKTDIEVTITEVTVTEANDLEDGLVWEHQNIGERDDDNRGDELVFTFEQEDSEIVHYEHSENFKIKDVIAKVHVVVRKFRKSPTKNDIIL